MYINPQLYITTTFGHATARNDPLFRATRNEAKREEKEPVIPEISLRAGRLKSIDKIAVRSATPGAGAGD